MSAARPGSARCFVGPDDELVVVDLRKRYDTIPTDGFRVQTLFDLHLSPLDPPARNTEKISTMFTKVSPFVPVEFQDDLLYAPPTVAQSVTAKTVKKARAGARKAAAASPKHFAYASAHAEEACATDDAELTALPAKRRGAAPPKKSRPARSVRPPQWIAHNLTWQCPARRRSRPDEHVWIYPPADAGLGVPIAAARSLTSGRRMRLSWNSAR